MSNNVQDILDHTGSSLITLNCIVAGLANQLKTTQGTAAVEAAQAHALEVAKAYSTADGVAPDMKLITDFFNAHK
ncbi:MAG: hypothetical protein ACRESJ_17405 [Pseudomonas sp.]|uniref:hypothetical protein n=1 Tax=Pseudomonas sp. TaxID=306 RepID=UPI003D6E657D